MKYKVGDIINVLVTGIEDYGIFVKVDDEYDGLIHISEISYDFVRKIDDYANVGENIFVEILAIDEENHNMKLSIKNIEYKNTGEKRSEINDEEGFKPLKEALIKWQEDYEYEK